MNYYLCVVVAALCIHEYHAIPITEQIYFYHYANNTQINGTELKIGEPLSDEIDLKLPWKFFIHGWTTNPQVSPWFHEGKEAYFTKSKYNIIFVDWSIPGNQTYVQSVRNAFGSGQFLGKFILHLIDNGVAFEDIHLLGHSLGSHMSAFCGKHIINATNGQRKIGRITGLDPAGPIYELNPLAPQNVNKQLLKTITLPPNLRLDKNDAQFVDILHSDSGQYGMKSNIGHVDFHPNGGGRIQPGCETTDDENCSHARSTKFFVESINNNNFVAHKCATYESYMNGCCAKNPIAYLGEYTNNTVRGVFYLNTNSEPPYALGMQKSPISVVCSNFQAITFTANYLIIFTLFYISRMF